MRRAVLLILIAITVAAPAAQQPSSSARPAYADAYDAWDRGDYVVALEQLKALVPGADQTLFEEIALLTGELYQTTELTADGRVPSFSPDGALIIYEVGPAASSRTRIVRNAPGYPVVAEFAGRGAIVDPAGKSIVYAGGTPATLMVRPLTAPASAEGTRVLPQAQQAMTVGGVMWSRDGSTLYFTAGDAAQNADHQIYAHTLGGDTRAITSGAGRRVLGGTVLEGGVIPFTIQGSGGRGGGPNATPATHWLLDASGTPRALAGAVSPATWSADGRTIAYISREGDANRLTVADTSGKTLWMLNTPDPLTAPALSADGSMVAFQRMLRDDWEVFVSDRDGRNVQRLTREIQHDVLPRFLSNGRILAMIGEARHRRSYVYDAKTGARQRLFHNNTVRTIAPEYSWQATPDGTRVLISADRDGNTVSPERGVYVVDLTKTITKADLVARIDANLAAERGLRSFAARVTKPLASAIRAVVDRASITRVFGYEKALFDFDSKHISQPGNLKAAEYLHATYASFGYTPEYQWFETQGALGGKTANVLATLKGTVHPDVIYVVSSHYDSVAVGPGADDDSSGTAALLEAARIMAGRPQPATIVFASFTGEEAGLRGSREFVRRVGEAKWNVAGALNNDMIGWSNDHRLDNTIRYSNPGIKDIQHSVALTFTDLITYDALYYRSTDAQAFYDAWGDIVGGIGSYPVLGNPHYHQPHDWLETINHKLVTEVAKTTAATLMVLSNTPSRLRGVTAKAGAAGTTVTWTPSPERDVKHYVVSWTPAGGTARRLVVMAPSATITNAPAGTEVRVIAVNGRGLEGWDHARAIVQ